MAAHSLCLIRAILQGEIAESATSRPRDLRLVGPAPKRLNQVVGLPIASKTNPTGSQVFKVIGPAVRCLRRCSRLLQNFGKQLLSLNISVTVQKQKSRQVENNTGIRLIAFLVLLLAFAKSLTNSNFELSPIDWSPRCPCRPYPQSRRMVLAQPIIELLQVALHDSISDRVEFRFINGGKLLKSLSQWVPWRFNVA